MSLRFRLTLWSTLTLAVVFAIFGTLAFFSVRYFLYKSIDDNLERKTTAILLYAQARQTIQLTHSSTTNQIDTVFYTIFDTQGNQQYSDRTLPVNEPLIHEALTGNTTMSTEKLLDGTQVRVWRRPIYFPGGQLVGVLQAATPLEIPDQILNELAFVFAASAVVLMIVAAAGSHLLTGRALRAVDKVTQKAHQIELSQDLSQRIPEPGTDDEVGHLVSTFNQMLARLQAAFEAQRRFVADSSHELRTPLTVIKSNLHLMRRTTDPQERAELIETTEAETSRLNRMVNNLLYIAQLQAGHDLKPVLRTVELDSLLLDLFARARSMAAFKNQKVALVHEDIAATRGDRDNLQHLLLNLADNAIKYTPEGGTISLGLWTDDGWARIEVTDNGPGIPETDREAVFERFFRTPEARQTERNGSGLGLAIVKSIAEAHGGRVEVFSRVGTGSTFRVWLPLIGSPTQPYIDQDDATEDARTALAVADGESDRSDVS